MVLRSSSLSADGALMHGLEAADHRNLVVAEHANEGRFHVLHLLGQASCGN